METAKIPDFSSVAALVNLTNYFGEVSSDEDFGRVFDRHHAEWRQRNPVLGVEDFAACTAELINKWLADIRRLERTETYLKWEEYQWAVRYLDVFIPELLARRKEHSRTNPKEYQTTKELFIDKEKEWLIKNSYNRLKDYLCLHNGERITLDDWLNRHSVSDTEMMPIKDESEEPMLLVYLKQLQCVKAKWVNPNFDKYCESNWGVKNFKDKKSSNAEIISELEEKNEDINVIRDEFINAYPSNQGKFKREAKQPEKTRVALVLQVNQSE